jgi:hypothetical protein
MKLVIGREPRYFRGAGTLFILTALITVGGCLGILWMRHSIEMSAQEIRELEVEIAKEERRLRYLDTRLAEIHQPHALARHAERLGLSLRPPISDQIVYVEGPSVGSESLIAQTPSEAASKTVIEPFRHTLDLAVIELLKRRQ